MFFHCIYIDRKIPRLVSFMFIKNCFLNILSHIWSKNIFNEKPPTQIFKFFTIHCFPSPPPCNSLIMQTQICIILYFCSPAFLDCWWTNPEGREIVKFLIHHENFSVLLKLRNQSYSTISLSIFFSFSFFIY